MMRRCIASLRPSSTTMRTLPSLSCLSACNMATSTTPTPRSSPSPSPSSAAKKTTSATAAADLPTPRVRSPAKKVSAAAAATIGGRPRRGGPGNSNPFAQFAQSATAGASTLGNIVPPKLADPATLPLFMKRWQQTVDMLQRGLASMAQQNENFTVQMDDGQLYINMGASGCYSFSIEQDTQKLCLFSPDSGVHKYIWDEVNDRWACDEDGHIMIELLTRQLIRVAKGLPEF